MCLGVVLGLAAVLVIDQSEAVGQRSRLNSAVFLHGHQNPAAELASQDVDYSECSCSCCEVAERTPEEIKIQSIYLKCAHKFTDAGSECGNKCKVTNNIVLPAGTSDKGINYDRFCFYYCQPFDTTVTGPCIRQNGTEQIMAGTKSGNGEDLDLPPQGQGDIIKPNPPTPPPKPPTLEEVPCRERLDCIETLMASARDKAQETWKLARDAAHAARAAAKGASMGDHIGAHKGNPGPVVITGDAFTAEQAVALSASLVDNLRSLRSANRLEKAALDVILGQLDEMQTKNLRNVFEQLDKNDDGVLSAVELKDGLEKAGLKMEEVTDGGTVVSFPEFLAATLDEKFEEVEHVSQSAFQVFDENGDGKISPQELEKALAHHSFEITFDAEYNAVDHEVFKSSVLDGFLALGVTQQDAAQLSITLRPGSIIAEVSGPKPIIESLQKLLSQGLTVEGHPGKLTSLALDKSQEEGTGADEAKELMKEGDANGDGEIDFNEFQSAVKKKTGSSSSTPTSSNAKDTKSSTSSTEKTTKNGGSSSASKKDSSVTPPPLGDAGGRGSSGPAGGLDIGAILG